MAEVLLLGLAAFLGGVGYGVWVLWVYLSHVRRRREHYLQHGHRRATMATPRSQTMPNPIMRYFDPEAGLMLPQQRAVSRRLRELAYDMDADLPDGPEKSAGLRKLLEARECLLRAAEDTP